MHANKRRCHESSVIVLSHYKLVFNFITHKWYLDTVKKERVFVNVFLDILVRGEA